MKQRRPSTDKKKKKTQNMQLISQSEGHMQRKRVQLMGEKPDESRELEVEGRQSPSWESDYKQLYIGTLLPVGMAEH